jgi:beta-lactamase class A
MELAPPSKLFTAILAFVGGVVLTVAAMIVLDASGDDAGVNGSPLRRTHTSYAYVSPLLACNVGATVPSSSLDDLRATLGGVIDSATAGGKVDAASVYFTQLDTGEWTEIDSDDGYVPASLMKVPVLMAYLKDAEQNPNLLLRQVTIETDPVPDEQQDIPPTSRVIVGQIYTIEQLLRLMTSYSDNRALVLLMHSVNPTTLGAVLGELGIPIPAPAGGYTITPRLYSRLFRILYNATYLSDEMSERALAMLGASDYGDGIVAGVDKGTRVAHKFGEANIKRSDRSPGHELHDCGIVYTDRPYLLCVMTRGGDVRELARLNADISRAAFTANRSRLAIAAAGRDDPS